MDYFFITLIQFLVPAGMLFGVLYGIFVLVKSQQNKPVQVAKNGVPLPPVAQKKSPTPLAYPAFFGVFVVALVLGFNVGLYDTFEMNRFPVLGMALFQSSLALGWAKMIWKKKTPAQLFLLSIVFLSGWGSVFRANGFIQSINFVAFLISFASLFVLEVRKHISVSILGYIQTFLKVFPASFQHFGRVAISILRSGKKGKGFSISSWIKTISITLIVVMLFISILSAGDPVFAEIMRDIREQLLGRVLWSLVLMFVASVYLSIKFPDQKSSDWKLSFLSERDVSFTLGGVITVLSVFLFVQFKYLFGGSQELLTQLDMTFSEYVRKGFVELLIAALLGGVVSYLVTVKTKSLDAAAKLKSWFTWGNVVLLLELGLLLVSALKRDLLYVDTYGLTRVRIVGGWFLFWLAGFLILLGAYCVWKKFTEKRIIAGVMALSSVVLLGLNMVNVDMWVARGTPGHHDYKDYFYINNLSEDAIPAWEASIPKIADDTQYLISKDVLTDEEKSQLAGLKLALISLQEKRNKLYLRYASDDWLKDNIDKIEGNRGGVLKYTEDGELPRYITRNRKWQALQLAERTAFEVISDNEELFFDRVEELLDEIWQYQRDANQSLIEQEQRLLYDFKYPFISINLRYYPQGPEYAP